MFCGQVRRAEIRRESQRYPGIAKKFPGKGLLIAQHDHAPVWKRWDKEALHYPNEEGIVQSCRRSGELCMSLSRRRIARQEINSLLARGEVLSILEVWARVNLLDRITQFTQVSRHPFPDGPWWKTQTGEAPGLKWCRIALKLSVAGAESLRQCLW